MFCGDLSTEIQPFFFRCRHLDFILFWLRCRLLKKVRLRLGEGKSCFYFVQRRDRLDYRLELRLIFFCLFLRVLRAGFILLERRSPVVVQVILCLHLGRIYLECRVSFLTRLSFSLVCESSFLVRWSHRPSLILIHHRSLKGWL